ncbi:hypothetical protein KI688_012853 [Linnemannia hyalina]|uniref:Galactose oxidase n=1 Tax=Linnemannia hyalina TaxID=64524 RepID=A0A9P8BTD6_9FUNG|nr:hypothetical protein KI688_012853 [Linnemannia hyalina]
MGGFYNTPKVGNLLTVFDPKTAAVMQRIEATDANNMTGGSAVWSTRRKTLLLFEGSRAVGTGEVKGIVQTAVREYDTTVADDGSKVILFGGAADANVILNTIHILDVDSAQWTQGQPAPAARTQMACAYHSELFIAFGGTSNQTAGLYSNQPIVYDVSKNQWVEYYSPSTNSTGAGIGAGIGAGEGGSTESSQKSNMGLIIGASVGVAVVCAVVLGYMMQKRRRVRKAVERDARTAALLSNGEDRYSDRRQTIHKKVAEAINNNSNSNDNNRVMAAAEHYAAKQTVGEPQALGSVEMGLQQSDRVPRSPHSNPDKKDESKTLLGGSTVGRDGDGSFTAAASAGKAISFVKRESPSSISPTSARRSPHTAIGAVYSNSRLEDVVVPTAK